MGGVAAAAIEALVPGVCPHCALPLAGDDRGLCGVCWSSLAPLVGTTCPRCGGVMDDGLEPCLECLRTEPPQAGMTIWGEHDGVLRTAVLALKHGRRDDLAAPLGRRLAARVAAAPWVADLEVVTWVPSHPLRVMRRPWAAAELLAREVASALDLPVRKLLARRGLGRQTGSSRARRLQLARHAYRAGRRLRGDVVLLVDDVTTTGATIRRAAGALRAAGAGSVYSAVLAQALDSRRVT